MVEWLGNMAPPSSASIELQLQQTLPDVTAVEPEQRVDVEHICPHVFSQTQQLQVGAHIRL